MMFSVCASPRSVSGMPAAAAQPVAAVMPGNDVDAYPVTQQEIQLLAAAPKDERITALEPDTRAPAPRRWMTAR